MIASILRTSIERRGIFLMLSFIVIGFGLFSYQKLPIDAVPDVTNVQVQINTSADGYSPLEVEQRITFPVETVLAGIPNLDYTLHSILLRFASYPLNTFSSLLIINPTVFCESTDAVKRRNNLY